MHKIHSFTGQARHFAGGNMFSMRSHNEMPPSVSQPPTKRPLPGAGSSSPIPPRGTMVTLSFNLAFNSNLPGPDASEVLYASPGAFKRWTMSADAPEDTPLHDLPVHAQNVDKLRGLCQEVSEGSQGALQATVVCATPKPIPGLQRGPLNGLVANVCLYGEAEHVTHMRGRILTETPISLVRWAMKSGFGKVLTGYAALRTGRY